MKYEIIWSKLTELSCILYWPCSRQTFHINHELDIDVSCWPQIDHFALLDFKHSYSVQLNYYYIIIKQNSFHKNMGSSVVMLVLAYHVRQQDCQGQAIWRYFLVKKSLIAPKNIWIKKSSFRIKKSHITCSSCIYLRLRSQRRERITQLDLRWKW